MSVADHLTHQGVKIPEPLTLEAEGTDAYVEARKYFKEIVDLDINLVRGHYFDEREVYNPVTEKMEVVQTPACVIGHVLYRVNPNYVEDVWQHSNDENWADVLWALPESWSSDQGVKAGLETAQYVNDVGGSAQEVLDGFDLAYGLMYRAERAGRNELNFTEMNLITKYHSAIQKKYEHRGQGTPYRFKAGCLCMDCVGIVEEACFLNQRYDAGHRVVSTV